ncbi:hypothetical protein TEA_022610 [Camellia sinensis var. sinensis]|uniref:Uncharacterized protein n=1 Tax=Camellia sinensis var. sinensis TaxID=542762 RepID=A0A4S4DQB4_CAMSN|nr:hypothetical protein TEA_022610 [Camellia sinensis var. sinensis]
MSMLKMNSSCGRTEMDSIRQEKVQRFEEFVDHRLKPDLVHAIAESSDLRKSIENLEKNSVTSLRTLVNLGSEVYMQADVPDTRRIFVDVGLGFHVEFTWSEALNYIIAREEKLARNRIPTSAESRLVGAVWTVKFTTVPAAKLLAYLHNEDREEKTRTDK